MYCRNLKRYNCKARPITAQEAGDRIHDNAQSISSSTRKQEVPLCPQDWEEKKNSTEANEREPGPSSVLLPLQSMSWTGRETLGDRTCIDMWNDARW